MSRKFYQGDGTVRGLYSASRSEPDMRQEMLATLDGVAPEIAKKQPVVLRIMRRDSNGHRIPCECVSSLTHEPDKDKFCPFCFGEGYKWDEILSKCYRVVLRSSVGLAGKEDLVQPGLMNIPLVTFYFPYDIPILVEPGHNESYDKVVELVLDTEGEAVRPYKRKMVYRIGTAIDFRSDNGKLEYWKLDCYGEKVKFLNGDC